MTRPEPPARARVRRAALATVLLLLVSGVLAGRPASYPAAVAFLSDTDGDGFDDLLVAPYSPMREAGDDTFIVARLHSGKTGALLREYASPWAEGSVYDLALAAIGDLDGDDVTDFALGCRSAGAGELSHAGSVVLIGTRSGKVLARIDGEAENRQFGHAVAAAGDVDGDGTPDVVVGSLSSNLVQVRSGRSGELLRAWQPETPGAQFGHSVDGGVDLSGDGVPDLLIGVPEPGIGNARAQGRGPGRVVVQSGADGGAVREARGRVRAEHFGHAVRFAADCDGDGTPDLLVGSPFATGEGRRACGRVTCLSGETGKPIWSALGGTPNARLGMALAVAPDLTGDGVPEIVAGATSYPTADPEEVDRLGEVLVLNGRSGLVLRTLRGGFEGGRFGEGLAASQAGEPLVAVAAAEGPAAEVYSLRDGKLIYRID